MVYAFGISGNATRQGLHFVLFCLFSDFILFRSETFAKAARHVSDSKHEQGSKRRAKVLNLFSPPSVCLVLSCAVSDFSIFPDKNALSGCAVGGLYSRRLNHKMPGVMTRSN